MDIEQGFWVITKTLDRLLGYLEILKQKISAIAEYI